MIKSGKNESFCEGMVKALVTKRVKSGKNGSFCEGMVKALFFKKTQKRVKKMSKTGVNSAVAWLPKSGLNAFFSGFFRNLEFARKNNPKGTSNCFPYDYQPHNFGNSEGAERRSGGGH